jgi:glycosyltransferase involved in cell wall biosynthesis
LSKRACNDVPVRGSVARPIDRASQPPASAERQGFAAGVARPQRRLLVISHPAIVSVNQEVYRELKRRGWDVSIVVPSHWRHEYSANDVTPEALEGMQATLRPTPILLAGRPQRHIYLTRCRSVIASWPPDVAFIEAEPFAFPATQWGRAFTRLGIPFGVQCYENIDRDLPGPVRWLRSRVLRDAAFVAARSDTAGRLARAWGAEGEVELAPPAVPAWEDAPASTEERPFTVGYAGRLVESKGLMDLLAAVRQLDAPVELLLIGNGEMRARLEGQPVPGSSVRILDGLRHDEMASGYAQLDVLVLPSLTTPTWKEQFGRVIVEGLWCGVPIVGSDSGEIPWLIELTGGGLTFPEGDRDALAERLKRLRDQPALRRQLAATGRAAVEKLFSVSAATDPLERMLVAACARGERSG